MGIREAAVTFFYDAPIYLPFAHYIGDRDFQYEERCRDFEINLANCLEAYGFHQGQTKCLALMHDLRECMYGPKQQLRSEILHGEHVRRVLKGEKEFEKVGFVGHFL